MWWLQKRIDDDKTQSFQKNLAKRNNEKSSNLSKFSGSCPDLRKKSKYELNPDGEIIDGHDSEENYDSIDDHTFRLFENQYCDFSNSNIDLVAINFE